MEYLKELCLINGVSGDEERVAGYICQRAKMMADSVTIDSLGNVIAKKAGRDHSKLVMAAAHMDEVGLIVKKIDADGYLKFETVGGIDVRVLPGKRVSVGPNAVPGVVGIKAVHLQTAEERKRAMPEERLYIDIGASNRAQAQKAVELGDYVSFEQGYTAFGEGFIRSKALDDRAGCAILLHLMEKPLQYDTCFVFTVQEEIGTRGAAVAAHKLAPDEAYIIETTTCADFTGCGDSEHVTDAKGGAVISVMDRGTIYDKELVRRAISLAEKYHIPHQMKKSIAGGNDSGAVHKSRAGVKTLALSIPCRYLHSPASVIAAADFEAVRDLTERLICGTWEEA